MNSPAEIGSQPPASFRFADVCEKELEHIGKRRDVAKISTGTTAAGAGTAEERSQELCGLALSGGGIRSACFNLGLLQAFHQFGLFRYVDYLATVSGGGYIGGHLSSWIVRHRKPIDAKHFPLQEDPAGRGQGKSVRHLIYGGDYIVEPLSAFNKYLIGVVLNNVAVFSLLVAAAALVAWVWRSLDFPWLRDRLALIGLGDDLSAPFVPCVIFLAAWVFAWMLSYWQKQAEAPGLTARHLLRMSLGSILVGFALLVGNGDIGVSWIESAAVPLSIPNAVWIPIVILILVALLPIIRPGQLLNSAISPTRPVDRLIFAITSSALLVGVPLILIGILGRENISGYSTFPQRGVDEADVRDWPAWCDILLGNGLTSIEPAPEPHPVAELYRQDATAAADGLREGRTGQGSRRPDAASSAPDGKKGFEGRLHWKPAPNESKKSISMVFDDLSRRERSRSLPEPKGESATTKWSEIAKVLREQFVIADLSPEKSGDILDTFGKESEIGRPTDWSAVSAADLPQIDQKFDPEFAWEYLQYLAIRITSASRAERHLKQDMERRQLIREEHRTAHHDGVPWDRTVTDDDLVRLYAIAGFVFNLDSDNEVARYWFALHECRRLRQTFTKFFNAHLLATDELAERLLNTAGAILSQSREDAITSDSARRAALVAARDRLVAVRDTYSSRSELSAANRRLMETCWPTIFRPPTEFQRRTVIHEDQWYRLEVAFCAGLLGLVLGCWIDINATSMHRYYRTRLASTFLVPPSDNRDSFELSELETTAYGAPYHLIGACVSFFGRRRAAADDATLLGPCAEGSVDDPRRMDTFLMSQEFVGSSASGYEKTHRYARSIVGQGNRLDLDEAIALSGAAVSPSQNQNLLVAFLMFCLNLRLGQWLPNPTRGRPRARPRLLFLLASLVLSREKRPYVFVSDGGHNDNLGLVELLKRRCRLIIVSDAGQDPTHQFSDLARALRTSRVFEGIRLVELGGSSDDCEVSLEPLQLQRDPVVQAAAGRRPKVPTTSRHFVAARILYPRGTADGRRAGPKEGLLLLIKPSFTGDEPPDLFEYREHNPSFPHQPTSDQVYDAAQVESYRHLGYHIGKDVCRYFRPEEQALDQPEASSDPDRNLHATDAAFTVPRLCEMFLRTFLLAASASAKQTPVAPRRPKATPRRDGEAEATSAGNSV